MGKIKIGDRLNGLLVVGLSERKDYFLFECPFCQKHWESYYYSVKRGKTTSCGCMYMGKPKHFQTKMDGYRSPTYQSWNAMVRRCTDKNDEHYEKYGAAGITVCERWLDLNNFIVDMGERPNGKTLDRFPNKFGNYEPGNVRWATQKEQANNLTTNLMVTYKGETKTLPQWCDELNLSYHRMRERIFKKGLSPEIAFHLPKNDGSLYNNNKWTPAKAAAQIKIYSLFVEYEGKKEALKPLCERLGISPKRMKYRIFKMGMTPEQAFSIKGKLPNPIKDKIKPISNFIPHSFGVVNKLTA